MMSSISPGPPPNTKPPGFGTNVVVVPVQKVFTTNATCVGPFDVNVTDAGSGVQVIVTDEVEQPNVTVPLNPGIAVSTSPIASLPPGGTGGNDPPAGGVTVIVIGEFETVRRVEPLTSFCVADIVVVRPAVGPVVARPPSSVMVAASGFDDAHATVDVMSFVLLSENVPVAVN
jgi:hypothetical protein